MSNANGKQQGPLGIRQRTRELADLYNDEKGPFGNLGSTERAEAFMAELRQEPLTELEEAMIRVFEGTANFYKGDLIFDFQKAGLVSGKADCAGGGRWEFWQPRDCGSHLFTHAGIYLFRKERNQRYRLEADRMVPTDWNGNEREEPVFFSPCPPHREDLTGKTFQSYQDSDFWTVLGYSNTSANAWVCQEARHLTTCEFYTSQIEAFMKKKED